MEKYENDTDEDEKEWEGSFVDSDPFELAAPDAPAGGGKLILALLNRKTQFFFSFVFVSVGLHFTQFQVKTQRKHQLQHPHTELFYILT